MTIRPLLITFALFTFVPAAAMAETARSILEISINADSERLSNVDNVTVIKQMMGQTTVEYFEKTLVSTSDGRQMNALRLIPITEIAERQSPSGGLNDATPDQLDMAADVIFSQKDAVGREFDREVQAVGMPPGFRQLLMNPPPDQPWLSPDPADMMGMYAGFLHSSAKAKRINAARDTGAEAKAQIDDAIALADEVEFLGEETVDGRQAFALRADNLDYTQVSDGDEFTINTVHLWIDATEHVPLRMKIDGMARSGGSDQPFSIERRDMDYRHVDGCGLYEPYRQVMNIAGVMSPQEQAQMQQAKQQLAEFEKQMAQMPTAQRDMIMRQMGPQMEMMKGMVAGGGMEMVTQVTEIRCNRAGPPSLLEIASLSTGGSTRGVPTTGPGTEK
jgi:hypothetical protein